MRLAKIIPAILAVVIVTGFTILAINSGAVTKDLNFKSPKLQSTQQKLNNLNLEYDSLNHQLLKLHSTDQKKIDKLNSDKKQLEKQRQDLQTQLQARVDEKERLRLAAANAANALTATQTASALSPSLPGGSHQDWMAAAGIAPGDYGYVDYIVSHESTWRITASNASGAYGLCQALPASKMASAGADWQTNPVTQLRWCASYAAGRGGWAASYYFWVNNRWW